MIDETIEHFDTDKFDEGDMGNMLDDTDLVIPDSYKAQDPKGFTYEFTGAQFLYVALQQTGSDAEDFKWAVVNKLIPR